MQTSPSGPPSPAQPAAADVLQTLLAVSLTGVILFRPVYDPAAPAELIDLAYVQLNPAAQRMLRLPECPADSFRTLYPHTGETGVFAFYRDTFLSGQAGRYDLNYSHDGLDNYFQLAAQRCGDVLVVSFTDTADHGRSAVEIVLRENQARAQELQQAQAQAATEAQRNRLHLLFAQFPTPLNIHTGPDHVFAWVHPQTAALLGHRPLLGRRRREALPELPEARHEPFDQAYRTGQPVHQVEVPARVARPGGTGELTDAYYDITYQPLFDAAGQVEGVMSISVDVTERVLVRRQAEDLQVQLLGAANRQLVERETFYQVFEQTPALIVLLRGPAHRIDYHNAAYQQYFPGRELLGRTVAEMSPEAERQGFVALLDQVYATGETYFGVEMPFVVESEPPSGQPPQVRYFNFTFQRFEEAGQPAGISEFAYDVTEQVLARRQREALSQRQQELFEQAPVAMGVFSGPDYVVEVCNPGLEAIWGYTAAQVLHRPVFEVMPEVEGQGFRELLDGVRLTGVPYVAHEMPGQTLRNGLLTTVYLDFVYHPLRDAQGNITAVAAVVIDVSEQVAARRHLAEANAELSAANQQLLRTNADLDTFVYTASHDLKAPITNIEGLLHALREELPAAVLQSDDVTPMLNRMQRAVERFHLTIAQLTDVSRLQQADTHPAETVDLITLVEDVRLDLAADLAAAGARLTVDVVACPSLLFAAKHLRSIVYNLLSNAVKYRHPARPPVVHLRCHGTPTATILEVTDNGLGLSEAQQARLYGMFRRLHDHVEGSGIGLYMVKRIVENAGGTIAVRSQPGTGTTFTVTLPVPAPEPGP